jgi:hypothetical protein
MEWVEAGKYNREKARSFDGMSELKLVDFIFIATFLRWWLESIPSLRASSVSVYLAKWSLPCTSTWSCEQTQVDQIHLAEAKQISPSGCYLGGKQDGRHYPKKPHRRRLLR